MQWVDAKEISALANVSERAVQKALHNIQCGHSTSWRGSELDIQITRGRGGKSGKQYLVSLESLPDHLQARYHALQEPVERALKPVQNKSEKITQEMWWHNLLRPLMADDLSRSERSALIENIVNRTDITDWKGRPKTISRSVIYIRLKALKTKGLGSQARKGRSDRGQSRTHVSLAYDKAVSFDSKTLEEIGYNVRQEIRGYLKGGADPQFIKVLVRDYLINETRSRGFNPNSGPSLETICKIPNSLITAEKRYKNVYRYRKDKKAHYDASPSNIRDWRGMPLEWVVADIHHENWIIRREDGSVATAKLIAFMDMATRRVWCDLIFFEKSGGVRNVDVFESLAAMWSDPSWGICKTLYMDNGSEYLFADYLDDAMELAFPSANENWAGKRPHTIRALPYNAKAKPIEAWFGEFGRYLRHLKGYIGDDRMKPKTDKIGKLPAPTECYEVGEHEFFQMLAAYENMPKPIFGDRSPNEVFADFVAKGWSATIVDRRDLAATIASRSTRIVRGDSVSVKNLVFAHESLGRYSGDSIVVVIPKYHAFDEVRIEDGKGNFICNAVSQEIYQPDDHRGAVSSFNRKRGFDGEMQKMDAETPNRDVGAKLIDFASRQEIAIPNEPKDIVSVTKDQPAARTFQPTSKRGGNSNSDKEIRRKEAEQLAIYRESAALMRQTNGESN